MRLWSIHPKYLDSKGLVALWRESLLAQKVLADKTKGYKNHPQLNRFKEHDRPRLAISSYLYYIYQEACRREYNFNRDKIEFINDMETTKLKKIIITDGQLVYELNHLKEKLIERDPELLERLKDIDVPDPHPIFEITEGKIASWEKID